MIVEFIIPTWERPNDLMVMLACLVAQKNPNWKATVIINGITDDYRKVKDTYQDDDRISFSHLEQNTPDWGHTPRNYGLDNATGDWIVMTSDDNYYAPVFVDLIITEGFSPNVCMIFCDLIHDRIMPGYQYMKSMLMEGYIDIGNAAYRRQYIGDIRIDTKSYTGDYKFARQFADSNKNKIIKKIDSVLFVHN